MDWDYGPRDPVMTECPSDRARTHRLIQRWGWNATSFQTLSDEFRYWFGAEGCVAYVEHGDSWVGAGPPIAAPDRLAEVARAFVLSARRRNKRPCFFAVESPFLRATAMPSIRLGEQPVYDPYGWREHLKGSRSLREQLRRARAKGVTVSSEESREFVRDELEAVHRLWLTHRPMPPMGFLTGLDPFGASPARRFFVARSRDRRAVGFVTLSPVYARSGVLFEHLVRRPDAPNGTVELLIDAAMRDLAQHGVTWATLGLAPLAGNVALPLRLLRSWAKPFYNFEGLRAFKAKLGPIAWDPIYLAYPTDCLGLGALHDGLRAFAQGRPISLALRSLSRKLRPPLHLDDCHVGREICCNLRI